MAAVGYALAGGVGAPALPWVEPQEGWGTLTLAGHSVVITGSAGSAPVGRSSTLEIESDDVLEAANARLRRPEPQPLRLKDQTAQVSSQKT
jgi:hypothetical protein